MSDRPRYSLDINKLYKAQGAVARLSILTPHGNTRETVKLRR